MSDLAFARYFVVVSSVALLLAIMVTFAIGPLFGIPLSYDQSFLVVKQVAPILIGYLGQSAYYIVKGDSPATLKIRERGLLRALCISPFVIFTVVFFCVIVAFIASNSASAAPGTGMSFTRFTDWIAVLLGVFTATISVLTAWLFGGASK